MPAGVRVTSVGGKIAIALLDAILLLVTLYVGWLIWAALVAGKGQTPARVLLRKRVVGTDGRPAGFAHMFFMRGIIGYVVAVFAYAFTLLVLWFMPLWDRRNQSVVDKVSGTIVVDDPNNAWNL